MRHSRYLRCRRPLLTLFCFTVLLALDGSGVLRVGLACALLHETGHLLMYRALWHRWPMLELSPLGISLLQRGLPMRPRQELLLAAAGPLANFAGAGAALLGMELLGHYTYGGYWFAGCSLLLGTANLLPLPPLDGAHILRCLIGE